MRKNNEKLTLKHTLFSGILAQHYSLVLANDI